MLLTNSEQDALGLAPPPAASGRLLVLAGHPDTAALLCNYAARSGLSASIPLDDEPAEVAVSRIRPRVAIIDCDHPSASSRRLSRRLAGVRARIVLCAALHRNAEARERALRTGALYFPLPVSHRDFELVVRTAMLL